LANIASVPEDLIEIQVFGVDQLARTVRVNSFGMVSLPSSARTAVGGMTATKPSAPSHASSPRTTCRIRRCSVFIKEYTNQRVTVEGACRSPASIRCAGRPRFFAPIAVAGGQGSLSDLSNIVIYRADSTGLRTGMTYDIEKIRRGEQDDPTVLNDDVVVVNRSPARVVLKDSIFRDALDAINPFSYIPK
jgi:polysaccharide export outer membrane protein